MDEAKQIQRRIAALDAAQGHWATAKPAEKRKDYPTAEAEYSRAVETAPWEVRRLLDLATFLARRNRWAESDGLFDLAATLFPKSPEVLFERAAVLIHAGRDGESARALLAAYLKMPLTPDLPSRREAERLLAQAGG